MELNESRMKVVMGAKVKPQRQNTVIQSRIYSTEVDLIFFLG